MNKLSKRKKLIALICMLAITMTAIPFFAVFASNRQTTVTVDGRLVLFAGQQPIMESNRVLVPVRGVFEHMGFEASWDSNARMARLERADMLILVPAEASSFTVTNRGVTPNTVHIITPDVPQRMVNNRMLLPLRAVSEAVGATAQWNINNRVAQIISPSSTPTPIPPTPTPAPQSVDIRYLLGQDRDIESFDAQRHMFGNQTGHSYYGAHERFYYFENGLTVNTVFTVRGIVGIRIDFTQAGNINAFHFNDINGTSTRQDVINLLGDEPYYYWSRYFHGAQRVTSEIYRIGDYRNVTFSFNQYGTVVEILFSIRHDALLI